jgi:hypothetical protein
MNLLDCNTSKLSETSKTLDIINETIVILNIFSELIRKN